MSNNTNLDEKNNYSYTQKNNYINSLTNKCAFDIYRDAINIINKKPICDDSEIFKINYYNKIFSYACNEFKNNHDKDTNICVNINDIIAAVHTNNEVEVSIFYILACAGELDFIVLCNNNKTPLSFYTDGNKKAIVIVSNTIKNGRSHYSMRAIEEYN